MIVESSRTGIESMNSPMKDHPLGLAARYNDADAEEKGLEAVISDRGLALEDVLYLADQRALRVVMIARGRVQELLGASRTDPTSFYLDSFERQLCETVKLAVLDGMMIGWRGREIQERDDG